MAAPQTERSSRRHALVAAWQHQSALARRGRRTKSMMLSTSLRYSWTEYAASTRSMISSVNTALQKMSNHVLATRQEHTRPCVLVG